MHQNAYTAFGRVDSLYHNYYQNWLLTSVARAFFAGDTVNKPSITWLNNTPLSLTNNSGSAGTYRNITDFVGDTDRYIGIKVKKPYDTVYGWIRVNCPNVNGPKSKCLIKEFSVYSFNAGLAESTGKDQKIRLFPSPVKEQLHIESPFSDSESIEISDVNGAIVKAESYTSVICIYNLKPGAYMLKVQRRNNGCVYSRFLKE